MKLRHPSVAILLITLSTAAGPIFIDVARCSGQTSAASDAEENQNQPDDEDENQGKNDDENEDAADRFVTPDKIVRDAFADPPAAKSLSKRRLWVDRDRQRVYVDGYVAMQDGPLEMFACPIGTKEHESIVATLARSSEVHAALLAIGAKPGTPVEFLPNFVPATGQRIRVWVCYRDAEGKYRAIDARRWVRKSGSERHMESDWVFAGSGFWKDPSDGREYYRADSGDMICVSNFNTAMMDVTIASSAEADELQFSPFTPRIPRRGTPVRLVLVPIPIPTDKPDATPKIDPNQPPGEAILPAGSNPPKTSNSDRPNR